MPTLVFTSGPVTGHRIPLEGDLVVGRENADVTIDDAELSRRHVRVSGADGATSVEDLGSLNGTFVNDQRIEGVVELRGGEIIRVGHSTFTLEPDPVPEPEPEPEPEPIADPNATRISEIPTAAAPPIADPSLTVTGDVPVTVPDATVTRPIPQEAEVERTVVGDRPAPEPAAAPPPPPPPPPAPAPRREPAPVAAAASASVEAPGEPFGALAQGGRRRGGVALAARGGVATRKLAPAALVIVIIIATTVALVLYFGLR